MGRYLLAIALALAAACAHAGMGYTVLPAREGRPETTVFYPRRAPEQLVVRGPYQLMLATDAAPDRGNGRLVVISHGSGGGAWTYADLARKLVEAGFVVALPLHEGDNWRDMGDAGPTSWKRRPGEVSRAIDAIAQEPRFAALLSLDKVGMHGMSAGGHTALSLAGGRWSPSRQLQHCEQHLDADFPTCVGLALQLTGGAFDGLKKAAARTMLRFKLDDPQWYTHDEPRIAAVVAEVPFAVDFDPASLAAPRVPLGIVQAGQDLWLAPRFHSGRVLAACKTCETVADVPGAGHGSFLAPQPQGLTGAAARLLADPPGFDRSLVPATHARVVAFMQRHLLP